MVFNKLVCSVCFFWILQEVNFEMILQGKCTNLTHLTNKVDSAGVFAAGGLHRLQCVSPLHPRGPMWSMPSHFLLRSVRLEEPCTCPLSLFSSLHFTSGDLSGAWRLPSLPFKGMLDRITVPLSLSLCLSYLFLNLCVATGLHTATYNHCIRKPSEIKWSKG